MPAASVGPGAPGQNGAPTIPSTSGIAQTAGRKQSESVSQNGGSWSLLGKMYGSQMLAYMVAIHDAKGIMDRMRHMHPGPSLHLPLEVAGMNIWQVLQGCLQKPRGWISPDKAQQQHASEPSLRDATPSAMSAAAATADMGKPRTATSQQQQNKCPSKPCSPSDRARTTHVCSTAAAAVSSSSSSDPLLTVSLCVLRSGNVQVLICCGGGPCPQARGCSRHISGYEVPQGPAAGQTQQTHYVPAVGEVRAAILSVLQAYIHTYLSRFSLQAFLEKQQQLQAAAQAQSVAGGAGADWEGGSIAASAVTRKTKITRKAPGSIVGVAVGNGDPVSYAMSSTSNTIKAALAARQAHSTAGSCKDGAAPATAGTASSVTVAALDTSGSPAAAAMTAAAPATPPAAAGATVSRSGAGKSLSCAHTVLSGAGGCAKSAAGGYAASVWGGSALGWDSTGDDVNAANSGPDELCLCGVMLLCREVGLIDNITEHLDIIRCFELMLHRKRGRLGPAKGRHGPSSTSSNTAAAVVSGSNKGISGTAGNATELQTSSQQLQPQPQQALKCSPKQFTQPNSNSSTGDAAAVAAHDPDMLLVVHVVRPGVPAAVEPSAASDGSTSGSKSGNPGSAAAHRVLTVESLTAEEVFELLILVMKERHPCYRRQPELLLRMLAAWHIALLQFRKPERGPPWLLRQVLQQQLLQSIECPATTEMLHGIYVHLAGSSANPQDLSMNLSDIRLGLKHAAGFRSQQDLPQLMQQQQFKQQNLDWSTSKPRSHGYEASTQSSKGRSVAQGMSLRTDSGTLRNGAVGSSTSDSPNSGGCKRTFHLPLYKVAEFLRAAKLLPRLFDKYITQLQRQGEEQKVRTANRGLPIMPSLRASAYYGNAREWRVAGHGAARHRSALKGSTGMTRLATLQERGSHLSGSVDGFSSQSRQQQQQQQQRPSLDGSSDDQRSMAAFLESSASLGAPVLDAMPSLARPGSGKMCSFNMAATAAASRVGLAATQTKPHDSLDGSTASRSSAQQAAASARVNSAGAPDGASAAVFRGSKSGTRHCSAPLLLGSSSRRLSGEYTGIIPAAGAADSPTRTVSMQRSLSRQSSTANAVGGVNGSMGSFVLSDKQQQPAGMMPDGQLDAALLDTAELLPARAKAASIVIGLDAFEMSYSDASKSNRAAGATQVLQLPSPHTYLIKKRSGAARGSAAVGRSPKVHKHGDAAWHELLKQQKAGNKHTKGGKMSYEQQQELLKQELQAAEADAAMSAELETARQDTWTVFVLVELLGSHLVTPSWSNPVRLPPSDSTTRTVLLDADGSTCSTDAGSSTSQTSVGYCSWNNGYVYTTAEDPCSAAATIINGHATGNAAAAPATYSSTTHRQYSSLTAGAAAATAGSTGSATTCGVRSGVPVDVMSYCITYPQFVEVLLCLMAGRATTLLEPDVKQLRNLTLDEEMQDHAKVVLERIKKWRAVQLTPWKVKPGTGNSAGASEGAASVSQTNSKDANGAKPADIQGPVARVYSVYSSMELGSSCLGLHQSGFLQMLADARVFAESDFAAAGATELFTSILTGSTTSATLQATTGASPAKQQNTTAKQLTPVNGGAAAVAGSANAGTVAAAGAVSTRAPFGAENRQSTFMRSVAHQLLERLAVSAAPDTPIAKAAGMPEAQTTQAQPADAAEVNLFIDQHADDTNLQLQDNTEALQPKDSADLLQWQQQLQNCTTIAVPAVSAVALCSQDGMPPLTNSRLNSTDPAEGQTGLHDFSSADGAPDGSARSVDGQGSKSGTCSCSAAAASESCANSNSRSSSRATTSDSARTSNAIGSALVLHNTRTSTPASTSSSGSSGASSNSSSSDVRGTTGQAATASCCSSSHVLTLQQFQQALVLLSRKCFPRISNAARAWKLLIDRHIQPLADRKRSRYDTYQGSLATPGVTALLTAWQEQLQQLFDTALATQHMQLTAQQQGRQQQQQHSYALQAVMQQHCGAAVLQLASFLEFLQHKAAVPQLLEPSDVQEVLKRLITQHTDQAQVFTGLSCSAFTQALAMCGLAVFAARRLQSSPLRQPEQQVAAFFSYLGLPPLPGQQQLLAGSAAQQQQPAGQQQHGSFKQRMLSQLSTDPYKEWWSLEFDPAAESRAHDHLSSLTYMPVMLEEAVLPPACCPTEVLPLLSAAQAAHQARQVDDALALYGLAEEAWRDLLLLQQQQQQQQHWEWEQQADMQDLLPAAAVLYLSVAISSCLLTGGRDDQAWEVLQSCEGVLADVHEAGADAALWHAAAGVALYHREDLQAAFEHCVRAYVTRAECAPLGAGHPDTAAAGHNLGVVLDCLGKSSRGLELVEAAQQVFASSLGSSHPRTLVAARNAQHIKHKLIKLPAEPQELLLHSQAATSAASAAAAGPALKGSRKGPAGPTNRPASRRAAASKGKTAGSNNKALQKGADQGSTVNTGYNSTSSESSGLAAGISSESDIEQLGKKGRAAAKGEAQAGASRNSKRSVQRNGSMKERLTAVIGSRQQHNGLQSEPSKQQEWREYTDLDHLGSGVFRASQAQRALYQAVKPDIEAHAKAGSYSMSWSGGTGPSGVGVVEMQVVAPGVLPVLPARPGSASLVLQQQRPVSPAALGAVNSTVPLPHILATGAVAATPAAAGAVPAALPGQLMRRGALLDATIATVKKPLTVEQARQLRRQQMLGNKQKLHDSLVDKLYCGAQFAAM